MRWRHLRPAAVAAAGLVILAACRPTETPVGAAGGDLVDVTVGSSTASASAGVDGYPSGAAEETGTAQPVGRDSRTKAASDAATSRAMAGSDVPGTSGPDGTSGTPGSAAMARPTDDRKHSLFPLVDHQVGSGIGANRAGDQSTGPATAIASDAGQAPESTPGSCAGIAQRDGERLVIDGQPFAFFGVNVPYLLDAGMPEDVVESTMADLSDRGVNTVRVWFFHEDDPERFARVLDLGQTYGIRFVVTLEDNVFEGRDWFFADEDEKRYRPHLQETVGRFKDRPEILMWEVVNEPNCGDRFDDDCLKTMKNWLTMSSRMVKEIDACHLVTTGMIGAGNYENEWANYRRIHKRDSIDVASVHRRTGEDRSRDLELAAEAGRPVVYGEIYDIAYDRGCSPLNGGAAPRERAERVKDDLRDSLEDGVDGYLLWDYAVGSIELDGGDVKHYCGEHGFERDDPLWDKLDAVPGLPAPVPWRDG